MCWLSPAHAHHGNEAGKRSGYREQQIGFRVKLLVAYHLTREVLDELFSLVMVLSHGGGEELREAEYHARGGLQREKTQQL